MIYKGISEMVGPFRPATVFGTKTMPVELIRLGLAFQETRDGQALVLGADEISQLTPAAKFSRIGVK